MSLQEKLIFKSDQIHEARDLVDVTLPKNYSKYNKSTSEEEEWEVSEEGKESALKKQEGEEYRSRRVQEIDSELESYREEKLKSIETEIEKANERLETSKEDSHNFSFTITQEAKEQAKKEIDTARNTSEQMLERAKLEVERMVKETEMRVSEIEHEAYQKGYDAGREVGYKSGSTETQRLINRLGIILSRAIEVRENLITDSEKQMIDMVLIIARKVIKDEISERKEVVLHNIREALKRVKDRDRIDIRVNFEDLELTAAHKDELIKMIESLRKVNIYEDSRVDRGGCIIETEIGSIDARISTQFKQIEDAITNTEPL